MNDRLVWIDCEMTGLDLSRDALIEIAALITDSELEQIGEGFSVLIAPPPDALAGMPPVVREMHTTSGLLRALDGVTTTLAAAEDSLLAFLEAAVPGGRTPLCGNSIATDRGFLARDMPRVDGFLHYRMIDVSSVKELCRRWYPQTYYASPPKHGGHRAMADIVESVAELRYYRSAIFRPAANGADSPQQNTEPPEPSTVIAD